MRRGVEHRDEAANLERLYRSFAVAPPDDCRGRPSVDGMKRIHTFVIALILAASAVAGLSAALHTTRLGAGSSPSRVSAAELARRNRELNLIEKRLLARAGATPSATTKPRPVVYVRPKPIVHIVHRRGERESESGDGGESGD
jgi:hypothetical protein